MVVSMNTSSESNRRRYPDANGWLELVRRHVESLDFGVVQIVVHASRVVQIERTEKIRVASNPIALSETQH